MNVLSFSRAVALAAPGSIWQISAEDKDFQTSWFRLAWQCGGNIPCQAR